jgi:nicotinamide-nucleotide amidase
MNAEILAIGSELLTPQRVDTNSLWLTGQLNDLGVEVAQKGVVGDDRGRLAKAIRDALERVPILILTGGLGPTEDDVTRDAVCEALGRGLVFHQETLDEIDERFRRRGRQMAEINKRQAYLIEGAKKLPNPRGTAPGQWIDDNGRIILLLPGPPREMMPMFTDQCLPGLRERLPKLAIRTRVYRVTNMTESDLDQLISPVYTKYENPVTTVLAASGDIQVHLRARCETAAEAEALVAEVGAQIEKLLGNNIYATSLDSLEMVVGQMLQARAATLTVAESCTGGMIGARLTGVPGSSKYFTGGFIVYSAKLKTDLLGVPAELIESHGVVSQEVSEAMATGARSRADATYALSITGEAGPEPGDPRVPVGTVWISVAAPDGVRSKLLRATGDREWIRAVATQSALSFLRDQLQRLS